MRYVDDIIPVYSLDDLEDKDKEFFWGLDEAKKKRIDVWMMVRALGDEHMYVKFPSGTLKESQYTDVQRATLEFVKNYVKELEEAGEYVGCFARYVFPDTLMIRVRMNKEYKEWKEKGAIYLDTSNWSKAKKKLSRYYIWEKVQSSFPSYSYDGFMKRMRVTDMFRDDTFFVDDENELYTLARWEFKGIDEATGKKMYKCCGYKENATFADFFNTPSEHKWVNYPMNKIDRKYFSPVERLYYKHEDDEVTALMKSLFNGILAYFEYNRIPFIEDNVWNMREILVKSSIIDFWEKLYKVTNASGDEFISCTWREGFDVEQYRIPYPKDCNILYRALDAAYHELAREIKKKQRKSKKK